MHTQIINFLPSVDEFAGNQAKWNSNEEVARILYSAQDHPEWISSEVRTFPPSTSQKLFKRLDGLHFKQDGYEWKRRKEGKLIREDHVKLKVQKLETIAGSYVHSAIVPSFHRRTYWLFDQPEIVLVHYLNVTSEETRDGQPLHIRIAQSGSSGCSASENRAVLSQAGNASQPDTSCPPPLIEIADLSPDRSPLKGGTKVLIVGGWYLRGHDYSVMFGDQQVPATLFHAGVLRCFAPPRSAGVVKLEVYCDGLLISHAVQFEYVDMSAAGGRSAVLAELGQRLSFVHSCLLTEGVDCMRELPETDAEAVVLEICNEMIQYPFNYSLLTSPPLEYNGNSLLHLCAMLNYHRTIRLLLQWRSEISSRFYMRDLDVVARDAEGRTPLHIAITHANLYTIQVLISHCPSSIDVLDDRGETPQDLVVKSRNMHIANTVKQSVEAVRQLNNKVVDERCTLSKESVNSTALWVMTNGETVTDEQRLARSSMLSSSSCLPQTRENRSPDKSLNGSSEFLDPNSANSNGSCDSSNEHHRVVHANSERSSWMDDPLSMDVHIPDSPTTAGMWSALTSNDDAASEEARARMANLAQQIIDALPARIKGSSTAVESNCLDDVGGLSEPSSSGLSGHSKNPFIGNAYVGSSSEWEELISPLDASNYGFTSPSSFMERTEDEAAAGEVGPLDVLNASPSPSTFSALHSASVRQSNTVEGAVGRRSPNTTDLGEFFNAEGVMGPLERHFRDLRLSGFHYFLAAETEIPVNKSNYYLKRLSMLVFSNPCSKHFATKEVDKPAEGLRGIVPLVSIGH
ncbi:Calmodulin-binding transcription activator 1 [Toxocara canis]|uniref:Calmodulin-binding transcription activator 1 n=1 Tax=Toxocara canis TaxID=6265 RepID=A0A0B2VVK0_TOXCA|nr:Calmodulin-binding transcription activator 1 [Toxocara canis]